MLQKSDSAALLHCVTRLWQSSCAGSKAEGVDVAKKKVKPRKTTKKSAPVRPKKKESLNVGYGALKGLANFGKLFGLGLSSSPVHVSGRYVWRGTPAFLVTNLSGEAATATLFNWGYWPIPGHCAEFTKQESVVWVRDTDVLHHYQLEDIHTVNYFGETDCPELQFYPFPQKVEDAAKLLGGFLDLEKFNKDIHTFGEDVLDDVESFKRQWKQLSKLRPVEFVSRAFQLPNNGLDQATDVKQKLIVFKNLDDSFHCDGFDLEPNNIPRVKGPKFHDHIESKKYFIEIDELCFTYEKDYGWGLTRQAACLKCALDAGVIVRTSKQKTRKVKAVKLK